MLDAWAGPITAALSAEMRFNAYDVTTNVPSSTFVDCTGLRLCNPLLPSFSQAVVQPVHASQNVWEVALEAEVPVLKDLPLIQAFDLNLAGRYTDYSVSGSVQTWKIGFNWNVVDSLRFRGTTSIDIRAPTLDDLFRPATLLQNVFTDLHIPDPTKSQVPNPQYFAGTTTFSSQGNPKLVPEVSRTYTVGAVWTPDFVPGLTMSLDYYRIHLANAIGSDRAQHHDPDHLRAVGRRLDLLRELSASAAVQRPHAREFRDQALHLQSQHRLHPDRGLGLRDQLRLADVGPGGGLEGLVERRGCWRPISRSSTNRCCFRARPGRACPIPAPASPLS